MSFEKQRLGKLSIRSFLLWYSSFFRSLQMMVQMKFGLVEFKSVKIFWHSYIWVISFQIVAPLGRTDVGESRH